MDKTGEIRRMGNGLEARIRAYRNYHDCDIEFVGSGQIVRHRMYGDFKRGEVKCPQVVERIDSSTSRIINPNTKRQTVFTVSTADVERVLAQGFWSADKEGYIRTKTGGRHIMLHRFIMGAVKGQIVDHRDGDTTNNTRDNLRLCTVSENNLNTRIYKNNTSGIKGVRLMPKSNKWRAVIWSNGRYYGLGVFANKHDATVAYNQAAIEYHKEFASLNVIPIDSPDTRTVNLTNNINWCIDADRENDLIDKSEDNVMAGGSESCPKRRLDRTLAVPSEKCHNRN